MTRIWQCTICHGDQDRRRFVNESLAQGRTQLAIEAESRTLGFPVKVETIRKHQKVCVANGVDKLLIPPKMGKRPADSAVPMSLAPLPDTDDFATLVRAQAVAQIKAGELKVTTQDGLAAQSLLDKREERRKDREVMVQIGRLLATKSAPPPMVIEGDYEEVDEQPLLVSGQPA